MENYGIHWFRRDLRVAGNPALVWNCQESRGRTLGVFFFDSKFLSRPDFSHHRFGFFLQTLLKLKHELQELGSDLLVLDKNPEEGFSYLFDKIKNKTAKMPTRVSFNRDYEPYARERDGRITKILDNFGIFVHTERDHLIIEPLEVQKQGSENSFYQIYTPYSKRWFDLLKEDEIQSRISVQKDALKYLKKKMSGQKIEPIFKMRWKDLLKKDSFEDSLDQYIQKNLPYVQIQLPLAGSVAAFNKVTEFKKKISNYLNDRDYPAQKGTSELSIYIKNGAITPAMILAALDLNLTEFKEKTGASQFLKEIVWREFYYHILYHQPRVEKEAFLSRYNLLEWENREAWFQAWKDGRTGYPIVDAGMRQLKSTGWMHNRVRMIVASFLTKDLLIDWKWGEKYFMNQLLDGDLAPNNGGWQWAASTGCDPQPYFRIFNPVLQSKKFDPNGDYIRKFLPELKSVPNSAIHAPWESSYKANYIKPLVDHTCQKVKALALYKKIPKT